MLQGKLTLHDIRDVEQFTGRIIQRAHLDLSAQDNEDLWAFLISTAWELSLLYERGDPQYPPQFSTYATNILRLRVKDWQRRDGRRTKWQFASHTYERVLPSFTTLDDRPDEPDPGEPVDAQVGGLSDLIGLLGARGGALPRGEHGLGEA